MRQQDPKRWMLAEAVELLEGADRLRRQFFQIGADLEGACWEPPVDMYAHDGGLRVLVALPGVAPDRCAVALEDAAIVVHGERALEEGTGAIVLLEIPYGRFERRISLPPGSYRMREMQFEHGCLKLLLEPIE